MQKYMLKTASNTTYLTAMQLRADETINSIASSSRLSSKKTLELLNATNEDITTYVSTASLIEEVSKYQKKNVTTVPKRPNTLAFLQKDLYTYFEVAYLDRYNDNRSTDYETLKRYNTVNTARVSVRSYTKTDNATPLYSYLPYFEGASNYWFFDKLTGEMPTTVPSGYRGFFTMTMLRDINGVLMVVGLFYENGVWSMQVPLDFNASSNYPPTFFNLFPGTLTNINYYNPDVAPESYVTASNGTKVRLFGKSNLTYSELVKNLSTGNSNSVLMGWLGAYDGELLKVGYYEAFQRMSKYNLANIIFESNNANKLVIGNASIGSNLASSALTYDEVKRTSSAINGNKPTLAQSGLSNQSNYDELFTKFGTKYQYLIANNNNSLNTTPLPKVIGTITYDNSYNTSSDERYGVRYPVDNTYLQDNFRTYFYMTVLVSTSDGYYLVVPVRLRRAEYSDTLNIASVGSSSFTNVKIQTQWFSSAQISTPTTPTRPPIETNDPPPPVQESPEEVPSKGGSIVNIQNRFSPTIATSATGVYPLTIPQIRTFINDIWERTLSERINEWVNGNAMDNVVGFRFYYGLNSSIQRTTESAYLTLGQIAFDGGFGSQSAISTRPASSEYVTFSCGELFIPRLFNNFLDFAPHTKVDIFLPYVGFVSLDATEVINRTIRVDYNITITTGASTVFVYVKGDMGDFRLMLQESTTMGVELSLNAKATDSMLSRLATTLAGASSIGVGAMTAIAAPQIALPAMAALGAGTSIVGNAITEPLSQPNTTMKRSGGMGSAIGNMSYMKPFVLITTPNTVAPSDYNKYVGSPDFKSGSITRMKENYPELNFIKISSMKKVSGEDKIPQSCMNDILNIMKAGVFIDEPK